MVLVGSAVPFSSDCRCLPTSRSFFIIAAAMGKPLQALMNRIPGAADKSCDLTHRMAN